MKKNNIKDATISCVQSNGLNNVSRFILFVCLFVCLFVKQRLRRKDRDNVNILLILTRQKFFFLLIFLLLLCRLVSASQKWDNKSNGQTLILSNEFGINKMQEKGAACSDKYYNVPGICAKSKGGRVPKSTVLM